MKKIRTGMWKLWFLAAAAMSAALALGGCSGKESAEASGTAGNGEEGAIAYAHLITDRELELGSEAPVDEEAASKIRILADGKEVEAEYLSWFDGMLNLRLAEPVKEPETAKLTAEVGTETLEVEYVPFYTMEYELNNVFVPVRGNENSGVNDTYDAQYVIDYCRGGMYQILGQSDYTGLTAAENGMAIAVVGADQSVYMAPEYREFYNEADAKTRRTIGGTPEHPVIVATADDIMRMDSTGEMERKKSDTFSMMEAFAGLFWDIGVTPGWEKFPLSINDDPDCYNYVKQLETAYENAGKAGLWPGTAMMEDVRSYFTYGTMVWYETIGESADGTWQKEAFPVNTRSELKEYDPELYSVLVGVYTENKYFCGTDEQCGMSEIDSEIRKNHPWFKHNQVDNYGTDGKEYAPLAVTEANLISANQVELVFNREVRDLDELRNGANWRIDWTRDGETTSFTAEGEGKNHLSVQRYQWKTLTFYLGDEEAEDGQVNVSTGSIGSSIMGFTEKDLEAAPEWLASDPEVAVSETALEKGEYIDAERLIRERNAGIDGELTVKVLQNGDKMCDWADHPLGDFESTVTFKPYLGQAYRSPKTGVYVYADNDVQKSSLEMAGAYIDIILSNETDHIGQRIADGLVKQNQGAQIIAYGHHAYQQPDLRHTYGNGMYMYYLYVEGFGGGICQTSEANLRRDLAYTRYKGEFILGHEFAHSIETGMRPYAMELYDEIGRVYENRAYERADGSTRWPEDTYAGSNRAEYFATLSNIWHGTMRESASGAWDGTLSPINTREELYRYDPVGYELMKKIYYNGTTNLSQPDGTEVTCTPDQDEILKWGSSFPASLKDAYPDANWIQWAASNDYDFDPENPEGDGIPYEEGKKNYHPYYN